MLLLQELTLEHPLKTQVKPVLPLMTPEHFLLETQTLLLQSQPQRIKPPGTDPKLLKAFRSFKSSLRSYLRIQGWRGLEARRHFLALSRSMGHGPTGPARKFRKRLESDVVKSEQHLF
ncbi:hypothetical protein BCR33DRAFT_711199 [Rhizoclosmatium globosum]|uniref:Uncharacterized protein n=1 Tax=Rhizoclosmatium globosum TaxID=329046 RepID=A0A1Y2D3N5_9FUNG|nr:hypothetical protein BCR33DRAFT_711199 [Rhizoclosmatium globosum]|eukprot:ORY53860.1 hypothetical protein BCR33DRAFT_711199 [Rhizoclosmatium globosum]